MSDKRFNISIGCVLKHEGNYFELCLWGKRIECVFSDFIFFSLEIYIKGNKIEMFFKLAIQYQIYLENVRNKTFSENDILYA